MDEVLLGRSGLSCSVLGLGGGSSSRFGLTKGGSKADALRLVRTALDEGITFFDGAGLAGGVDELLAEGLSNRRHDVVLSTKIHLGPDPLSAMPFPNRVSSYAARRIGWVCSGATVRARVERTLVALHTDRIDVLHLHAVTPRQYPLAVAKVLPELLKMKDEGKLRAIGITEGFLSDPGHAMLRTASLDAHFDVIMVGLHAGRSNAADVVLQRARAADLGVIGMFALRSLVGSGSHAHELRRICEEESIPLPELAYRFCRHHAGINVVLTGTGNVAHLQQNIAAVLAPPLPESFLRRLQQMAVGEAGQADVEPTRK